MSVDLKTLRIGDRIRLNCVVEVQGVDTGDPRLPLCLRFPGPELVFAWLPASALEDATMVGRPLGVGDEVVHRDVGAGPSRTVEAIIDFKGEPHIVCLGWCLDSGEKGRILVPAANYVRVET